MKAIKIMVILFFISLSIAAIFFFSDQTGDNSHTESRLVADRIAEFITSDSENAATNKEIEIISRALDKPIRKLAHLFIYFCLGFIVFTSVRVLGLGKSRPVCILFCILFVVAIASADEFNQMFKEGRGASLKDVVIDTVGGTIGIYFYFIITDFIKRFKAFVSNIKSKA